MLTERTALIMIDMQRDFLEPGGFGESLGNDVSILRTCVQPCQNLLAAAREAGLMIVHTREGHRPDLSDVHPAKQARCAPGKKIVDEWRHGKIMNQGQPGNQIIADLAPLPSEPVVDKPGKGAFYATDLELMLRANNIEDLIICGVTTEVCVHTTVREANDRGYRVVVPQDCCASYFPEYHRVSIEIITAQGGIFGSVTDSKELTSTLNGL